MESFVKRSLLYDFYGELMTDHQKRIYQEIVFDDFSISEVARDEGISRQGVHDLMKRCDRLLEEYEERLHLVEKFLRIRSSIDEILSLTDAESADGEGSGGNNIPADERIDRIRGIAVKIREEL